jgi:uncharacterized protein YggE
MRMILLASFLAACSVAQAEEPRLSITGTGTVSVEPDEGYITVGVNVVAPTSAEAVNKNTEAMQKLYEKLGTLNVDKKNIRTVEFSLSEHYTQVQTEMLDKNGVPIVKSVKDGFVVSNQIRITVCDLQQFGKVLDAVVQDGANQVYGISFGSSKAEEETDKARALATKDALRKAAILTKGLGVNLGPVTSVSESSGTPRMMYAASLQAADASGGNVPVSGGTLTFSVSVNVQWALGDSPLPVKGPAVIHLPPIQFQPRERK